MTLTIFGAIIRARLFVSTGLFRDDAWVALSSRVGLGTAWHMWVTAPGYGFLERTWILLGPRHTWWYQLPEFVCAVAAVPAAFFLARYFRLGRCAALVVAIVVCTSPICVNYSTALKEYPVDFLLSCLLLALAEAARRRPERGPLLAFAVASAGAFVVSGSVGVLVVGLWAALVVATVHDRAALWSVLVAGAVTAAACAALIAVFYSHLTPYLTYYWRKDFIEHSSIHGFVVSSTDLARKLIFPNLLYLHTGRTFGLLFVIVCAAFSLVAVLRDRAMLGPALAVIVAFVASAAREVPLGTGRTDEYLYPPLLLLVAAGVSRVLAALMRRSEGEMYRTALAAFGIVLVLTAAVLLEHSYREDRAYPGVDIPSLATELHRAEQPGEYVFVNEATRYPWAFYEDTPLRIEFGSDWDTGFTVVSTDPHVFIAPSDDDEGGARPVQWVDDTEAYTRVWYVWTKPRSIDGKSYKVFLRDGWQPVRTIDAQEGGATLLVHSALGAGRASAPSPSTRARVPAAPTGVTVVKKKPGKLKVTFTAGADNGSTITGYRVLCSSSNGGVSGSRTGKASPIKVKGLTTGDSYRCTVTASNARGAGLPSAASAAVTA